MRAITRVEEFDVRGAKAVDKIRSLIRSREPMEIFMKGIHGEGFRIPTNYNFLQETLGMVKGIMKEIKSCKLIVTQKQMSLFR
jgi:hypothetical protein